MIRNGTLNFTAPAFDSVSAEKGVKTWKTFYAYISYRLNL